MSLLARRNEKGEVSCFGWRTAATVSTLNFLRKGGVLKVCLYSSVPDKVLFERVGFYRDDIAALRNRGCDVVATNSVREVWVSSPGLVVCYFYSKSLLAGIAARARGAEVVLTGGADQISPSLFSGWRLILRRFLAIGCLVCADRLLLSCSDDVRNFRKLCFGLNFLERKIEKVNHVVSPASIPVRVDKVVRGTFRAFTLCWMGSVDNVKRKGVDRAVRFVAMLRRLGVDSELEIAGTEGPGLQFIQEIVKSCEAQEYVRFLGSITEEEKNARFVGNWVYLQLSEHEGFGVAAAEAFFSGATVVHSNRGGLGDVIGSKGLIIDPSIIDRGDLSAISSFYERVLAYVPDLSYLRAALPSYSLEMRGEALCGGRYE